MLVAVITVARPAREASGQEGAAQGRVSGSKRAGHIYLMAVGDDPLRGAVAIDPNDGSWRKIANEIHQQARVSPDGRRLAIRRFLRGTPDPGLWIYDTTGEKDAFRVSERQGNPLWSPDGSEILLAAIMGRGQVEYWRMPADGAREARVPFPTTELVLDWSPDGQWIVSASMRKRPERPIYLTHPDGTGERLLLAASDPVPQIGGTIGLSGRFSRDGRKVLFTHGIQEKVGRPAAFTSTALLLLDVDGGPPRRFFERANDGLTTSASWSPDGKELAVHVLGNDPGQPAERATSRIEVLDIEGRVLKKIPLPDPGSVMIARNILDWR